MNDEASSGEGQGRSVTAEPLIYVDRTACRECWSCVRACPARAIRAVDGSSDVIAE